MPRTHRLRPAGLLAALFGVLPVACGTEYIELLPQSAGSTMAVSGKGGQSPSGSGGLEITAGSAGVSAGRGGMGGHPTTGAGEGGAAGSFPNGGRGGYGCVGFGCGGMPMNGGNAGNGGSTDPRCQDPSAPWCTPCSSDDECHPTLNCNVRIALCAPRCTAATECPKDGVCDLAYSACGPCFSDEQCKADGDLKRQACEFGRCVQCNDDGDCMRGACIGLQCVVCDSDKDCMGSKHCEKSQGRCVM